MIMPPATTAAPTVEMTDSTCGHKQTWPAVAQQDLCLLKTHRTQSTISNMDTASHTGLSGMRLRRLHTAASAAGMTCAHLAKDDPAEQRSQQHLAATSAEPELQERSDSAFMH